MDNAVHQANSIGNRIRNIVLRDTMRSSTEWEENMILFLETESERRKLEDDKKLADQDLSTFLRNSDIIQNVRARRLDVERTRLRVPRIPAHLKGWQNFLKKIYNIILFQNLIFKTASFRRCIENTSSIHTMKIVHVDHHLSTKSQNRNLSRNQKQSQNRRRTISPNRNQLVAIFLHSSVSLNYHRFLLRQDIEMRVRARLIGKMKMNPRCCLQKLKKSTKLQISFERKFLGLKKIWINRNHFRLNKYLKLLGINISSQLNHNFLEWMPAQLDLLQVLHRQLITVHNPSIQFSHPKLQSSQVQFKL